MLGMNWFIIMKKKKKIIQICLKTLLILKITRGRLFFFF